MHCNYETNTLTDVKEIGFNAIIVINGNFKVNHTCNEFPFTLNGNYLIYIEDCRIYLDKWYNKKGYSNTIIIPNPIRNITTSDSPLTLEQLHYKNIENIKMIRELKQHEKIQNISISTIVIITIIIICIYIYIKIRNRNIRQNGVTINLPSIPLGTGQASSSGGVISTHSKNEQKLPFE